MESYTKDGVESNDTQSRNGVVSLNDTDLRKSNVMGSEFIGRLIINSFSSIVYGFQDIIEEDEDPFFESANSSKDKSLMNEYVNFPNPMDSNEFEMPTKGANRHRPKPSLTSSANKELSKNDRSVIHGTKPYIEMNDAKYSEGDDGLRRVQGNVEVRFPMFVRFEAFSSAGVGLREAVLNDEIRRLKHMLNETSQKEYKSDASSLDSKENELGGEKSII